MLELYSLCGVWSLTDNKHWDFKFDVDRGASVTFVKEDISLIDLVKDLCEDYGINGYGVKISYAIPDRPEFPPIFLRNDRQLQAFMQKFVNSGGLLQLYVSVDEVQTSSIAMTENSNTARDDPAHLLLQNQQSQSKGRIEDDENNEYERSTSSASERQSKSKQRIEEDENTEHQRSVKAAPKSCSMPNERVFGSETSSISANCSAWDRGHVSSSYRGQVSSTDTNGDELFIGKIFRNKPEMVKLFKAVAMKEGFEYKVYKSDGSRVIAHCIDSKCSWRVRAIRVHATEGFHITKYVSKHSCDTSLNNLNHRQATAKTLATIVSRHFEGGHIGLRPRQLVDYVRNNQGIEISYQKAWRTQEEATNIARGTVVDGYEMLPMWLHMMQEKNPGTVIAVEVNSCGKFKYAFLALGQSITGFKLMRKVVIMDGTFLKANFKGTLLAASAQDGNFQCYPIAFGIVDSENDKSWDWFLKKLKTIIPDEPDLVFVSDRAMCIANGLTINYPAAHHGICVYHLQKNLETTFRNSPLIAVAIQAANAYTIQEFEKLFRELDLADPEMADYLIKADFKKWARVYAPANRYNIMTSNLAESLNSLLKEAREYPIVCLLETIRSVLTRWFCERREEAGHHRHPVTKNVGDRMKGLFNLNSRWFEAYRVDEFEFEVKGDKQKHVVHLGRRECSCRMFDIEKFPCAHAIIAAKKAKVSENSYVHDVYSTERWKQSYSESIHPVGDKAFWNIPDYVAQFVCLPPSTRAPSGRRRMKRIKSNWEFGRYKTKQNKCSRCHQKGHNKKNCVNPIN